MIVKTLQGNAAIVENASPPVNCGKCNGATTDAWGLEILMGTDGLFVCFKCIFDLLGVAHD